MDINYRQFTKLNLNCTTYLVNNSLSVKNLCSPKKSSNTKQRPEISLKNALASEKNNKKIKIIKHVLSLVSKS